MRSRRQAGSGLQRYLPRLVLAWQQDQPDTLVQEVEGSLVFADVSGFTAMSERLPGVGRAGSGGGGGKRRPLPQGRVGGAPPSAMLPHAAEASSSSEVTRSFSSSRAT